ncbi:hypothetical protein Slin15195_G116840 [Septoria linicola]|uniref:F-box domain-containing protein n=1 Tax=Septoria linicola TaxID=215465 RepID=A0A9Q9EPR7_9PEZI|nr:hypothetical protein Slin14017_G093840 [Septoria linicola]USW58365.1 hypothetical protein Slin15195_G116840 [Septoria linicola]
MAFLDDLPAELVENIVHCMTLHEICALRLANRSIASKASQDHFRSFYRSKRVDIDERGLKDFVVVTANAGMGCLIDDFTLTGLVYNSLSISSQLRSGNMRQTTEVSDGGHIKTGWRSSTEEERNALQRQLNTLQRRQEAQLHFLQSEDAQRLLVKAFRNIVKGRSPHKQLSVTLDLAVFREDALIRSTPVQGGSWRMIWQAAADTFQLVDDAIDASTLPIHTLRIFPAYGNNAQRRCALFCTEVPHVIKYSGLETCLARLKTLTLTFSDASIKFDDRDAELVTLCDKHELARQQRGGSTTHDLNRMMEAQRSENFTGLVSFVQSCHHLETLDLHRYRLMKGPNSTGNIQGDKISHLLFQRLTLPHLRDCRLRGFRVGSENTLMFLQRHRLHKLLLKNFVLSAGTFRVIFDHCTGDGKDVQTAQPDLERIEFEDLFQEETFVALTINQTVTRERLVTYVGPDIEHDSDIGGLRSNNMIQRWRTGTKRPIQYITHDLTGNAMLRLGEKKKNMEEFGPPDYTH